MKTELMAKGITVLAEATQKEPGETANKIVEFFEQPGVKATLYILLATALVVGVCFLVHIGLKKMGITISKR